ncbi:hypothetical protein WMF38_32100 [Sorangium sp. So ce118]
MARAALQDPQGSARVGVAGRATPQCTASGERFRDTDGLGLLERVYVGGLYERHKAGTRQTHVHHVHGPDGPAADIVVDGSGRRVSYVVPDALGSTAVRFDATLAPPEQPGDPTSWPKVRATLPDVTPDSYRTPTATGPQLTGPGYAGGDQVARAEVATLVRHDSVS